MEFVESDSRQLFLCREPHWRDSARVATVGAKAPPRATRRDGWRDPSPALADEISAPQMLFHRLVDEAEIGA